jgi:molybdopterin-guanine dinucleotide biosynthesis protein A
MKISAIYVSPGHNFFGRHGKPAGEHVTSSVREVECVTGRGLLGDRFFDFKQDYAGQITFFDEAVHRRVLSELKPAPCSPAAYRRNVLTRGSDLMALVGKEFEVQGVRFLGVGESKPCYWMEQAVAVGAEIFLRGDGGLRAKILSDGHLRVDCGTAAGVLFAGGQSRRMGQDKATMMWEGRTLGEHQAATLAGSGAWPLLLSLRAEQTWTPSGFVRIEDRETGAGPLGALVQAFTATDADVLTTLAIDLPLVTSELLERMTGRARDAAVSVVPWRNGRFEPLAAAWHRSALMALRAGLERSASFQETCAGLIAEGRLAVFALNAEEESRLANVNSPDDLRRLGDQALNGSLDAARLGFLPRRLPNGQT